MVPKTGRGGIGDLRHTHRLGGTSALRVLLVGSSGGHLAQLIALRSWWEDRERRWVTFRTPDAVSLLGAEDVDWAHHPTTRNVGNLLRNSALAWRVLRQYRPDVIVSTGAAVALPFFLWGRLSGVTTVYVEVYDRVDSATLTGRLCHPLTDLFLVQWEEQLSLYRSAELTGPLL
jgi:UDP-N-acetylglucosamine:LPS N-acetylglucosamine transferase